jgi:hypothetical protein
MWEAVHQNTQLDKCRYHLSQSLQWLQFPLSLLYLQWLRYLQLHPSLPYLQSHQFHRYRQLHRFLPFLQYHQSHLFHQSLQYPLWLRYLLSHQFLQ